MGIYRAVAAVTNLYNSRLGAQVRFQALPTPFDLYTDGMENPVIEEFGAGTEALHLEDLAARRALMGSPVYRDRFRAQWKSKLASRAYHRDLSEARIVHCPDPTLDGRTFADVAAERGADELDTFLDLQIAYGNDLRWYSVVANADARHLEWIMASPAAMIGFSDAGAHLRNMAFYNFGLRMLKRVRDAQHEGRAFMTVEHAVHKLTADIADFYRIDAGRLDEGARADVVVHRPRSPRRHRRGHPRGAHAGLPGPTTPRAPQRRDGQGGAGQRSGRLAGRARRRPTWAARTTSARCWAWARHRCDLGVRRTTDERCRLSRDGRRRPPRTAHR